MATFNGDHENLEFRCKSCDYKKTIEIDLDCEADKERLWVWLKKHSANGGNYVNIPKSIEKIPVAERTEDQHQKLIEKYGGVREYLLTMGAFKE